MVLIAKVKATKKGKALNVNGFEVGGSGRDGRKIYNIYQASTGFKSCSCMAFRFAKGTKTCKHIELLRNAPKSNDIVYVTH
jgi:hypothetical protein